MESPNAGRWVHANKEADQTLQRSKIRQVISFGRFRHLAWVEFDSRHYLASVGYEYEPDSSALLALDDIQGFDTCLLAEIPVQPKAHPLEVVNIVGAAKKGDADYNGHGNADIMQLFPRISVFECAGGMADEYVWSTFLEICVVESHYGGSWIEPPLSDSLATLAQLNVPSLPYRELCRSVLDLDPRSLYMSLYRCLEATYAFEKASKLAASLDVSLAWHQVAAILDSEMGWRAPEAQSLNVALAHAQEGDLREICECLKVDVGQDLRASAGGAIYKLRNQIVHYRPSRNQLNFESIDWNRACNLLVAIALDVFHRAYA